MRIVSFLPSATEMLFALDLADQVVGVTFECDYPIEAQTKPKVVHSHLPPGLPPAEIDALVRAEGAQGRSLYFADLALLEQLAPDLILLQDLCRVCAIDSPALARDLHELTSRPQTLSLSAHSLTGVLQDIERLGAVTGHTTQATALTTHLRQRIATVSGRSPGPPLPRVLALEWLDPFFQGGHWIPEMITLAGGVPVLATAGEKSVRISIEQIQEADPDLIVLMPCGYHLPETLQQHRETQYPELWNRLRAVRAGSVFAVDGSAFFSRPGPRLVEGLEILSAILCSHPGDYIQLPPPSNG